MSNDNAFSEAMFRTLKYHPAYPDKPFDTLKEACQWMKNFQHWYNEEHRHSALNFVTPGQRHRGEDEEILRRRSEVYASAKAKRPERWSGTSRNWDRPERVALNPQKPRQDDGKTEVIAK